MENSPLDLLLKENTEPFLWYKDLDKHLIETLTSLNKLKEELIKLKLEEKGFRNLLQGLKRRRFPKVCCVRQGEWELYFADDDTDEGAFIIGFRDVRHEPFSKDGKYSVTATVQYQDTLPLINHAIYNSY